MTKICTDIKQSQKLIELGIDVDTADMHYVPYPNDEGWYDIPIIGKAYIPLNQLPCWSLSALLGVIPEVSLNSFKDGGWNVMVKHDGRMIYGDKDNPVDACVELIIKLKEQKLL